MAGEVYLILCDLAWTMLWGIMAAAVMTGGICGAIWYKRYVDFKKKEEAERPLPGWIRRLY